MPPPPAEQAAPDPAEIKALIDNYYEKKPNFTQYIGKSQPAETSNEEGLADLHLGKSPEDLARAFWFPGYDVKMPVHPAEERAGGNITDQIAKDSSDSTASSHQQHQGDSGASSGGALGAQAHKANPGPVMAENIGAPASKEELKKRAEELNK